MTRQDLYRQGVELVDEFLKLQGEEGLNGLLKFHTYQEVADGAVPSCQAVDFFKRAVRLGLKGPARGRYTGLYYMGRAFVNVPVTAVPIQKPAMRSWSWPGWKTDRTAIGVCAHETGHFLVHGLSLDIRSWAAELKCQPKKPVSGYAPTAEEQFAETARLFILNPDLLRKAVPWRYEWLTDVAGLVPVPKLLRKGWRKVLGNAAYDQAAERWIG
jgi:hypothetical protein